jgi:uncharacterized protein YlaI
MAKDHKMVKQWSFLPTKNKNKCGICGKKKATRSRTFISGKITLYHCDECHKIHISRKRY